MAKTFVICVTVVLCSMIGSCTVTSLADTEKYYAALAVSNDPIGLACASKSVAMTASTCAIRAAK